MRFAEVKPLLWQWMNVWEEGRFVGLVKGVEEEALICGFGTGHDGEFAVESAGRRFNSMVLSGKVLAAVWIGAGGQGSARLSGGAGPCGLDNIMLRSWMLRHGAHSERLVC